MSCQLVSVETTSARPVVDLIQQGALPASCGLRMNKDNPFDPLGAIAKIVKGDPAKPGSYPWQVRRTFGSFTG